MPVSAAVHAAAPFGATEFGLQVIVTDEGTVGLAVIVILNVPHTPVNPARLEQALMVAVPVVPGAVYLPPAVIDPTLALHVTPLLGMPVTAAAQLLVPFVWMLCGLQSGATDAAFG